LKMGTTDCHKTLLRNIPEQHISHYHPYPLTVRVEKFLPSLTL
jgi:hypothetical protein